MSISEYAATVQTVGQLASLLRHLRRREARNRDGAELTYREIAARTGWSHAIVGEYLAGTALPPTARFDQLVQILGATRAELGPLATARDRVEESRRPARLVSRIDAAGEGQRVPHELPASVPGFVGRHGPLDQLNHIEADDSGLAVAAICGGAGIGKTALAVRWAQQSMEIFPDGQLFIDLRGGLPDGAVDPGDALARFLRALGVEPARVPVGTDERATVYRTLMAGRRMLVILDNAASAEQVLPLLPGSPNCMVIVTSRESLAALVAVAGAARIELDGLTEPEALTLLRSLLSGREDDDDVLRALAGLCGGSPLALRVAAELLASRDASLGEIAEAVGDHQCPVNGAPAP